jgi:Flp pilus assembly protein TadD
VAPGTAAANPARRQVQQIERALAASRTEEAAGLLGPLIKAAPDHPRLLSLQAELLFLQGEYRRALEVAREAVRRNRTSSRARALRNLIAATAEAVKGLVPHRSPGGHFVIHTPRGKDEVLAPFAGRTLEAVREVLRQSLGCASSEPVRVEIYSGPEVLASVSPLSLEEIARSGTIALSKYNRLIIVTPRALLRGYPWLDTLAHEYAHLCITRLSQNNAPIWIHEGLAKYFEAAWRQAVGTAPPLSPAQEHLLAEALRAGQLIRFEQMHPSMAKLPDQRATALAFAEVQTAIEFVAQKAGPQALRRLVTALGAGKAEWQALEAASGLGRREFEAGWRRHLRARNLRRLNGLVPPELQFGKPPTKEQRLAAIKESRARKLLRLAELLRTRRLTRAAIVEYQKARALLGPRDDLSSNHLARAYLEISSPAQAISALLPVIEYYPELPAPQTTMGIAYLKSGDLEAAAQHLRAALRLNPFDPEIHCGLAAALKSKIPDEAALHAELCRKLAD